MPICKYCGDEIEFRYVGGQPTPIHINGGWCAEYPDNSSARSGKSFGSVTAYVNPNAYCPVCGESVYFYQSPSGGRVFFDDLGWPWPKHPCTDQAKAQSVSVTLSQKVQHKTFRTVSGEPLQVYRLAELHEQDDKVRLKFSRVDQPLMVFRGDMTKAALQGRDITGEDLRRAPSFVVRFYVEYRLIEFISDRKKRIESFQLPISS